MEEHKVATWSPTTWHNEAYDLCGHVTEVHVAALFKAAAAMVRDRSNLG